MWPTRTIRAQALSLRNGRTSSSQLNGLNGPEIIIRELIQPVSVPRRVLVGATAAASWQDRPRGNRSRPEGLPDLGMTIYWVIYHLALLADLVVVIPPIVMVVVLFVGLFCLSPASTRSPTPRLRQQV